MVNGYYRATEGSKGRRGVEYSFNHVDRVRVDQSSKTPPGYPVPGSRRRQNIANHLDLATTKVPRQYYCQLPYSKRIPDYNNNQNHLNLQDYYSHIQTKEVEQCEENYYESYGNYQTDDIYDLKEINGNDVCSLRRTRSLAVIREETYNDLQINSTRSSRRSQLIPRAKLVNRSFARERHQRGKQYREDDSTGSGIDTQTSETRESDDYYANLKRLDSVKIFRPSWRNEKSDLDSINSDYFKNSQHQKDEFDETQTLLSRSGTKQYKVLEIELHQESSVLPETTTSNSDRSDSSTQGPESFSKTATESEGIASSEGTLTLKRPKNEKSDPVISYDSIYLSSEDSSAETVLQSRAVEKKEDSPESEASLEAGQIVAAAKTENLERLYTKVSKTNPSTKPKILAVTTKRGALERLSCISTSQLLKTNDLQVFDSFRPSVDNHFYSLPDISIGKSLKVSERIDAKLRSSYISRTEFDDNIDPNSTLARKHKRVRQRAFSEIDSLACANISLISVDNSIIPPNLNHNESSVETNQQQSEIEISEETFCADKYTGDIEEDDTLPGNNQGAQDSAFFRPQGNFRLDLATENFPGQIRIVVTDSQNNIIEEDSIESKVCLRDNNNNHNCDWNFNEYKPHPDDNELADSIDVYQYHIANRKQQENSPEATCCFNGSKNSGYIKGILKKDCREAKAEIHFPPPPSIPPSSRSVEANANGRKSNVKNFIKSKMSRPQILHVVDSKRHQDTIDGQSSTGNVAKEFLEKVDSVRCYWSKIVQDDKDSQVQSSSSERNFVKSLEDEIDMKTTTPEIKHKSFSTTVNRNVDEGLKSFSPSVEIIELNGEKQATIFKASNVDETEFDHVRYRVVKPNQVHRDILSRSKREAQFDGLIQYLRDYSFQELLSNNNIVIIEPVRTKIEKPAESTVKLEPINCKITGGSGTDTKAAPSKRHFFYQPVRVNRELLEEELPHPDTVRNARRFFEEHVLQKQPGTSIKSHTLDNNGIGKRRSLRYLTIDTSYGNSTGLRKWDSASLSSGISSGDLSSPCECNDEHDHQHHHHHNHQHHHHIQHNGHGVKDDEDNNEAFESEENLCEDEMCGSESYYVSEDVLEKIRECGSTVTYYGGRVVDNKSPELSPVTRAIMQEIRGKELPDDHSMTTSKRICNACQSNGVCSQDEEAEAKYRQDKHLGIQFRLVKSNSCSSRLELLGTDKQFPIIEESNTDTNKYRSPSPAQCPEESVKELVNRLETGTIKNSSIPRIIESKCIEKTHQRSFIPTKSNEDGGITINNHRIGAKEYLGLADDFVNNVTVNNHTPCNSAVNFSVKEKSNPSNASKIPRNKNVDLAFEMIRNGGASKSTTAQKKSMVQEKEENLIEEFNLKSRNEFKDDAITNETSDSAFVRNNCFSIDENDKNVSSGRLATTDFVSKSNTDQALLKMQRKSGEMSPETTANSLVGKHYVTNDRRLIEQRKYDEIEFEEFEVYSPELVARKKAMENEQSKGDLQPAESFEEII